MATQKKKLGLDPMNMAYGLGAAIVLIGVMLEFLNHPLASILIIVGFMTEAIVFTISAFERAQEEQKQYDWERIFPQLRHENESPIERLEELIDQANLDPTIIERLSGSIEKLEQNIKQMTEVSNTAQLASRIDSMIQVSENYENEISKLSTFMGELNESYSQSVAQMNNEKLVVQVERLAEQTERFEREFKQLNQSITDMNAQYGKMLDVMGARQGRVQE